MHRERNAGRLYHVLHLPLGLDQMPAAVVAMKDLLVFLRPETAHEQGMHKGRERERMRPAALGL